MTDGGDVFSTHTAPNPYTTCFGPGPTVTGWPVTWFVAGSIRYTTPLSAVTHTLPPPVAMPLKSSTPGVVILATTRSVTGSIRLTAPNPETHTVSTVATTSTAPWTRICDANTGRTGETTALPWWPRRPYSRKSGRATPASTRTVRIPAPTRLRRRRDVALPRTPSRCGSKEGPP